MRVNILPHLCAFIKALLLRMHPKYYASYILQPVLHFPLFSSSSLPINSTTCKVSPGSPFWPSVMQWHALNNSISGQLLAPLPPAAVCGEALHVFNNVSCTYVAPKYDLYNFHAQDPVSVMQPNWENDACLPSTGVHCYLQQFPNYVVNATQPTHIRAAVDFARENKIRLTVKGTGHDYLGM